MNIQADPEDFKDAIKNWLIGDDEQEPLDQEIEEVLVKVGQRKYFIIVCYDITEPKRLVRTAKVCLGFGERVQKSVFECHLKLNQLNKLVEQLLQVIDPELDCLRIYKIAGEPNVLTWGKIPLTQDEELIII